MTQNGVEAYPNSASVENYSSRVDESSCQVKSAQLTGFRRVTVTIEWRIEEFGLLMELSNVGVYLESAKTTAGKSEWRMRIYPRGSNQATAGYASFHLQLVENPDTGQESSATISAVYQIFAVDASHNRVQILSRKKKSFTPGSLTGYEALLAHGSTKELLQRDGSMMITTEVEYLIPGSAPPPADAGVETLKTNCLSSLGKLLDGALQSDCTILVGAEVIPAHRCLLAARSPVFAAMFSENTFKEAREGIIELDDSASVDAVKAMLNYVYSGVVEVGIGGDKAVDLLRLAGKYGLDDLKSHMEQRIAVEISAENFYTVSVLADMHSCPALKKACARFLSSHSDEIMRGQQWTELKKKNPVYATELLEKIVHSFEWDSPPPPKQAESVNAKVVDTKQS